jgi:NADPH:quinone reductase-like Zn-dependent oxidoreductase
MMTRAYSIDAQDIATEWSRVGTVAEDFDVARVLKLDELELRPLGPRDVRMKTLAFSLEHNIDHAVLADTINIAELRGGKIFPGNSAVGEITEVGPEVTRFSPGDIVVTHCLGEPDAYGYPLRIWAYDKPESIGWYSEEAVLGDWQVLPAPLDCGLSLWEIAALPLRAPTAYLLWRRGHDIFRVKVSREKLARLNVLGFGGGVSELFLMLAKHEGHRAFFCSGSPERRAALEKLGIESIDQKEFSRFATGDDVKAFAREVKKRTNGEGMHVVCDMLRGPVFPAGIAAMARAGVNVSAGWQLGKSVTYDSAGLSVKQLTIDHTHYETIDGCGACTELYGTVFKPAIHEEIYGFEDLPRALREMHDNVQTGIPIVRVATDLPASVSAIAGGPTTSANGNG